VTTELDPSDYGLQAVLAAYPTLAELAEGLKRCDIVLSRETLKEIEEKDRGHLHVLEITDDQAVCIKKKMPQVPHVKG
jgi:hypothetical protein